MKKVDYIKCKEAVELFSKLDIDKDALQKLNTIISLAKKNLNKKIYSNFCKASSKWMYAVICVYRAYGSDKANETLKYVVYKLANLYNSIVKDKSKKYTGKFNKFDSNKILGLVRNCKSVILKKMGMYKKVKPNYIKTSQVVKGNIKTPSKVNQKQVTVPSNTNDMKIIGYAIMGLATLMLVYSLLRSD